MNHYWNCPALPQDRESEALSSPGVGESTPEAETGSEDALGPPEEASRDDASDPRDDALVLATQEEASESDDD